MLDRLAQRAEKTRRELAQSQTRGGYLPPGNPYRHMPRWMPYWLAASLAWVLSPGSSAPPANDRPSERKRSGSAARRLA
ncbi:hypothetical protein [Ancylobacter terrae]|uniref:hypothetical protein n=1 Tax=Ancylobacter sp. sgz301288 TaxID=3342077 RepID=UPI00385877AB